MQGIQIKISQQKLNDSLTNWTEKNITNFSKFIYIYSKSLCTIQNVKNNKKKLKNVNTSIEISVA